MKIAYASRTGNIQSLIDTLHIIDAVYIETGEEAIQEEFILFTYTDGYGDIPMEVETFLAKNGTLLRGVIVSGDTSYGEAYCQAGDKIAETYQVPCLYKCEGAGSPQDIKAMQALLSSH